MDTNSNIKDNEIGFVTSNRGYIIYLDGLPTAKINDVIQDENGVRALISALNTNYIEALVLDEATISPGQTFYQTGQSLSIAVDNVLIGRAINPLGTPLDGKGMLTKSLSKVNYSIDTPARGIEKREFITNQLVTGITLIDHLVPLGKGQRELIIGDSNSGVLDFLINLVVNQKDTGVICVYAIIGKPSNYIRNIIDTLTTNHSFAHTVIVASSATENTPLIMLTPKTAFSVAEYFQSQGKDVLIILDDMGIQAKTYREISLLGGKSPGRESFPGDIFYQQASLLERGGNFNKTAGTGSITALPVIELNLSDFTGFVPTNLMAITDGHLLFKSNLYNKNQRPAIDISLSVSRVGRQTQNIVSNLVSRKVRQVLAQAAQLETVSQFSAELPPETQLLLRQKEMIEEIIKQDDLVKIPLEIQSILFTLIFTSFLKDKNAAFVRKFKPFLTQLFTTEPKFKQISDAILLHKTEAELVNSLETQSSQLNELCK